MGSSVVLVTYDKRKKSMQLLSKIRMSKSISFLVRYFFKSQSSIKRSASPEHWLILSSRKRDSWKDEEKKVNKAFLCTESY